jgi:DNA-binding NarL/FixJ family response regulator
VSEITRTAVLLDRQPMWLQAVETVLERANVRVVGKAADVETALALVRENKPHLLVADASLDAGGGFQYVQAARTEAPGIKCIVLSSDDDPQKIEAALAAGAVAYVLKTAHSDDLASAVRQAFEQSIYLAYSAGRGAVRSTPSSAAVSELTNRERQILLLAAEGHSNAQLARMLWVTEQTVKFHLSNVYRKINVSNRTEAARWAQVHGLLEGATLDGGAGASARPSRVPSMALLNGDSHRPARRTGRRAEAAHH